MRKDAASALVVLSPPLCNLQCRLLDFSNNTGAAACLLPSLTSLTAGCRDFKSVRICLQEFPSLRSACLTMMSIDFETTEKTSSTSKSKCSTSFSSLRLIGAIANHGLQVVCQLLSCAPLRALVLESSQKCPYLDDGTPLTIFSQLTRLQVPQANAAGIPNSPCRQNPAIGRETD